jgi:galactose-1-phosphate uridylyltransferase
MIRPSDLVSPHRRFNLLTGEWLLVSPQRALRPWRGHEGKALAEDRPVYDSVCTVPETGGPVTQPHYRHLVFSMTFQLPRQKRGRQARSFVSAEPVPGAMRCSLIAD